MAVEKSAQPADGELAPKAHGNRLLRFGIPAAVLGAAGFIFEPTVVPALAQAAGDFTNLLTPHVVEGTMAVLGGTTIASAVFAGSRPKGSESAAGVAALTTMAAPVAMGLVGGMAAHAGVGDTLLLAGGGLATGFMTAVGISGNMLNRKVGDNHSADVRAAWMRRMGTAPMIAGAAGLGATAVAAATGMHLPDLPVAEAVGIIGTGLAAPAAVAWGLTKREVGRPAGLAE